MDKKLARKNLRTALLGITIHWVLLVAGLALTVGVLVAWIMGARRELEELPAEHHAGPAAGPPAA
jgi:hypothetical protein